MEFEYSYNSTSTESINENLIYEDFQNLKTQEIISYISLYFNNLINQNYKNKNKKKERQNDLNRIIKYTQIEKSTLIISFIYILHIIEKGKYIICKNNIYRLILSSCLIAFKFNEEKNYFKNSYFGKIGGINLNEINFLEYSILSKINYQLYIDENEFYFLVEQIIKNEK